jgi:hypothetical protein
MLPLLETPTTIVAPPPLNSLSPRGTVITSYAATMCWYRPSYFDHFFILKFSKPISQEDETIRMNIQNELSSEL